MRMRKSKTEKRSKMRRKVRKKFIQPTAEEVAGTRSQVAAPQASNTQETPLVTTTQPATAQAVTLRGRRILSLHFVNAVFF